MNRTYPILLVSLAILALPALGFAQDCKSNDQNFSCAARHVAEWTPANQDVNGWLAQLSMDYAKAGAFKSSFQFAEAIPNPSKRYRQQAWIYAELAMFHRANGKNDQARSTLAFAEGVAEKIGDYTDKALACVDLGMRYDQIGDKAKAASFADRAYEYSKKITGKSKSDLEGRHQARFMTSKLYSMSGKFTKGVALALRLKGVSDDPKIGHHKDAALLFASMKLYDAAKYETAIKTASSISADYVPKTEFILAVAASGEYFQAFTLAETFSTPYKKAAALAELAVLHHEAGRQNPAIKAIDMAVDWVNKMENPGSKVRGLAKIAGYAARIDYAHKASATLEAATEEGKKIDNLVKRAMAMQDIATQYALMQDWINTKELLLLVLAEDIKKKAIVEMAKDPRGIAIYPKIMEFAKPYEGDQEFMGDLYTAFVETYAADQKFAADFPLLIQAAQTAQSIQGDPKKKLLKALTDTYMSKDEIEKGVELGSMLDSALAKASYHVKAMAYYDSRDDAEMTGQYLTMAMQALDAAPSGEKKDRLLAQVAGANASIGQFDQAMLKLVEIGTAKYQASLLCKMGVAANKAGYKVSGKEKKALAKLFKKLQL